MEDNYEAARVAGRDADTEGARVMAAARFTVEQLNSRRGHQPDFLGSDLPVLGLQPAKANETWLHYTHFSILLDRPRRLPRLTIVDIDGARWRNITRKEGDVWSIDPRVGRDEQPDKSFYQTPDPRFNPAHNDFAFGHMVRRQDPDWEERDGDGLAELADIDTFHLTNTAPQAEKLNTGTWNDLEDAILNDIKRTFRVRVVVLTGPVLVGSDPLLHGAIGIPREFWKIAAWRDGNRLATAGWRQFQPQGVLPTEAGQVPFRPEKSNVWLVPIADLAILTGLDLAPYVAADTYHARKAMSGREISSLAPLAPRSGADLLMRTPEAPSFERLGITPGEAIEIEAALAYREREENGDAATESTPSGATLAGRLSERALTMIVDYETGGRAYYENYYKKRPVWPKENSGITIGFGYDLGYVTLAEFRRDWEGKLPSAHMQALETTVGRHSGPGADSADTMAALLASVRHVTVEWEIAESVFRTTTLPKFARETFAALPNCAALDGNCFGTLISLTFNRGSSGYSKAHDPQRDPKDRYREMRAIKAAMTARRFDLIPGELRSMIRVWVGTSVETGLRRRRLDEAKLFEDGLASHPQQVGVQEAGPAEEKASDVTASHSDAHAHIEHDDLQGAGGRGRLD